MRQIAGAWILASFALTAAAQTSILVDATAGRHTIDPRIYGVNFASQQQLTELNVPLNRSGGNSETRYNWQQNSSNRASDWYFESLEGSSFTAGAQADAFIAATKNASAEPMITIPMIGWVSKLGLQNARLCSFSVAKYGAQQSTDWQWFPDCGNGRRADGSLITGNDPNDANLAVDSQFQAAWIAHLKTTWGAANAGGVRYYLLDNEHSLWSDTHRDVKPAGASMDEMLSRIIDYGSMIKSADPNAQVVGPEEWGWMGMLYSGADQQWASANSNWSTWPDKTAHGGWFYYPWLLAKFREYEAQHEQRVVDMVSIHYYPQGGEYSNDTSTSMQARRNRSTRSLWDPNYTDETWIGEKMRFIPRLRDWIDQYYPGAPLAITEYSWGADEHINGATTQSDVLGIFGREGVAAGTRWVVPATGTPAYNAIRMYRNYNGANGTFGEIAVRTTVPDPDTTSAFGSVRGSDGALTLMLINKQTLTSAVIVNLANYAASGNVKRWELTSSNAITARTDLAVASNAISITLPAQSITLLVVAGLTDVIAPTLAITGEAVNQNDDWTFNGTAADAGGISRVTWKTTTGLSGTATGTTSWSVSGVHLSGFEAITLTAWDNSGNPTFLYRNVRQSWLAPPLQRPVARERAVRLR